VTLLDRIIARGMLASADPIIATRLERHLRRIQPDPLFRRRLRSVVVNRYVAAREGLVPPAPHAARRQMGALGRGVLYASLLTAVSTTAAGAAAQAAIPGDALYAVKIELEQLRMQIAPPSLRDDLAAMAVDARLDELERLASAGRWDLVSEAAARAAAAEELLTSLRAAALGGQAVDPMTADQRHAERLELLLSVAPASARDGLQRALDASIGQSGQHNQPGEPGEPGEAPNGAPAPGVAASPHPTPQQPRPSDAGQPQATPQASDDTEGQGGDSDAQSGGSAQGTDGTQRAQSGKQ
jgi:hypothetical protein